MSDLKDDSAAVSVINVVIFKRIGRAKPVFIAWEMCCFTANLLIYIQTNTYQIRCNITVILRTFFCHQTVLFSLLQQYLL
ncbi:hypothetical protein AK51_14415 [Serratia nematodiphila DZ0503SBS1]|nr:hypothetical protein AK51_14415 [Serratia nematodiphila DZ0503SBS1]